MPVALGIDYEDIIHTPAYRSLEKTDNITLDLRSITRKLLMLFADSDVQVTFFIVSELAERYPDLIREIADAGHEIASHTATHCSLVNASLEESEEEIETSKRRLEAIAGVPVSGFRAPTCQINDQVYETLCEMGYRYSSSVMNSLPIPGFYSNTYDFEGPTTIHTRSGTIAEMPLSVTPRAKLPISGAWVRLLGRQFFLRSVRSLQSRSLPVVTYSHPWEFSDNTGTNLPYRCRVRTGEWLFETYAELLNSDYEFCTVSEIVDRIEPIEQYALDTDYSR